MGATKVRGPPWRQLLGYQMNTNKWAGSGLEVTHVESGEHTHSFKTAGPCPVVAWSPVRYFLAYSDLGILRIVGIDTERK